MKNLLFFVLLAFSRILLANTTANVNSHGVILDGYDPVSYFQGTEPKKGNPQIQTKMGDVTYYFSSAENLKEFNSNPIKYTPQFEGWCAYAVSEKSEKVEVDPKSFLIQDGRLLLFYKGFLNDTKDKWQHDKSKTPAQYLQQADKNWPNTRLKEP